MKTKFTLALLAMAALCQAQQTEMRDLGNFKKINASKGVNISLTQGKQTEMEVNVDGCALEEYVQQMVDAATAEKAESDSELFTHIKKESSSSR